MHVVQFTDCENVSTYGCCLTVTHLMQVLFLIVVVVLAVAVAMVVDVVVVVVAVVVIIVVVVIIFKFHRQKNIRYGWCWPC